MHRMGSGVTQFFDTVFAKRYDPHYAAPSGGYRHDVAASHRGHGRSMRMCTDADPHGRTPGPPECGDDVVGDRKKGCVLPSSSTAV